MQWRCSGDAAEMQRRCRGDAAEMQRSDERDAGEAHGKRQCKHSSIWCSMLTCAHARRRAMHLRRSQRTRGSRRATQRRAHQQADVHRVEYVIDSLVDLAYPEVVVAGQLRRQHAAAQEHGPHRVGPHQAWVLHQRPLHKGVCHDELGGGQAESEGESHHERLHHTHRRN